MFKIIGKITSIIHAGCTLLIVFVFAFGAYSIYLIKSGRGLGSVLGTTDRPFLMADSNAEQNLDSKLETFDDSLKEDNSADLILSEYEATLFLNSYLSELQDYYVNIFDNFLVDIESGRAYIYADGPGGTDLKIQFISDIENGGVVKADEIYIGKLRVPGIAREKVNGIVYQGLEQLKTNNFGGIKVTRLKFLEDSLVLELTKI